MSIGGIINGITGGLLGGGSATSGGGGSEGAWVTEPMAAGSYGSVTAASQARQVTWQSLLAGTVGTYAYVRAHQLQSRMVDLYKRGVEQADEYLRLAQRHYGEIALPTYERQRDHFDFVVRNWRPKMAAYIDEGMRLKNYTPDYTSQMGRFMGLAQAEFDKARRQRGRMRGKFELGRACHEDTIFSIRAAEARVAAASAGYRFEDNKKMEMEQWYWQRWSAAADLMSASMANTISGINQGSATATTALSSVGAAVERGQGARSYLGAQGIGGQRNMFGQLSQGAFGWAMRDPTNQRLSGEITSANTVPRETIASITGGGTSNIINGMQGVTGFMGGTSIINSRNKGGAPN